MTESLFLALSVSYMICLVKERWVLCGVLGLLAALCRSPGALLAGAAVIWAIQFVRREKKRPSLGVVWAAAGPAAGLGYLFCDQLGRLRKMESVLGVSVGALVPEDGVVFQYSAVSARLCGELVG